jgi:D-xylose transport system permease protein
MATATTADSRLTPRSGSALRDVVIASIRHNTKQYTMILALIAIWLILSILTDGVFISSRNLSNLFVQTVTTAILAIGMVLVIVTGHIDLSVGSVLGFAGAVCATLMVKLGWGVLPSIGVTLLTGLAIGAWHGFWVAYRKVPAFIVTLASMLAFRGLIIGITGGQTQGLEMAPPHVAEAFKQIGQGYVPTLTAAAQGEFHDTSALISLGLIAAVVLAGWRRRAARLKFGFAVLPVYLEIARVALICAIIAAFSMILVRHLGLPWSVVLMGALAVLFSFIASNTTFGRHLYAIGGNPEAARLSGIDLARNTMALFMTMGVVVAIAGVVYTSRLGAATTSAGQNAELDAIAAAVIGGTSLLGGEGTIIGAVVGALVMASLDNGMSLMNLDITFQYVIKGLILLLAVWVDMAQRKR